MEKRNIEDPAEGVLEIEKKLTEVFGRMVCICVEEVRRGGGGPLSNPGGYGGLSGKRMLFWVGNTTRGEVSYSLSQAETIL